MIKFKFDVEINKPIDEVFTLFTDRTLMPRWQPGLLSDEKLPGNKYKLTFRMGRRNILMTETILRSSKPNHDTLYSLKGIRNTTLNTFHPNGSSSTKWTQSIEFRFKGLMVLIGPFMKNGLEQQPKVIINNFKMF